MVDRLVLEHGQVEFVIDQAFGDMRLQLHVAADRRQLAQPRAFVGNRKAFAHAQREGGIQIEEERRAVVVVEEHQHVGPLLGQPRGHWRVAVEQRFPYRVLLLALVVGHPDGGNVRGPDTADDACHVVLLRRGPGPGRGRRASVGDWDLQRDGSQQRTTNDFGSPKRYPWDPNCHQAISSARFLYT